MNVFLDGLACFDTLRPMGELADPGQQLLLHDRVLSILSSIIEERWYLDDDEARALLHALSRLGYKSHDLAGSRENVRCPPSRLNPCRALHARHIVGQVMHAASPDGTWSLVCEGPFSGAYRRWLEMGTFCTCSLADQPPASPVGMWGEYMAASPPAPPPPSTPKGKKKKSKKNTPARKANKAARKSRRANR